jgi:hypothetical protein
MKKAIFISITLFLAGCSAQNTPNFILKTFDEQAYYKKMAAESCKNYQDNRVVQIDGVGGYYDYTVSNQRDCAIAGKEVLQPYQNPNRHGAHWNDIYPIGKTN